MGEPIDDQRVRRAIDVLRAAACAIVTAFPGGLAIRAFLPVLTSEPAYDVAPAFAGSPSDYEWAGVVIVGALAACAGWHSRDARSALRAMAIAGTACGPVTVGLLGSIGTPGQWPEIEISVLSATLAMMCSTPLGFVIGWCFGIAFLPLVNMLGGLGRRVTITTMPRALCTAGLWCALGLSVVAMWRAPIARMQDVATVGAAIAWAVVVGGAVEALRRRRLARHAARGEARGWSVAQAPDGTRWLVREARVGDGAYREGALRVRWGRLDG
ncbi:hypothetical protein [Sandaracinus amylolyticus]|uniref:hypothetical protein n=1 Tax=Sandaracinus amylolyticus TaxID=927083 RepID=UPI001F37C85F|nr:hypothetical protein [Sandaracinus amylolyticus]UJR85276.1 Hypothetical protein I5071_73560 [Sandaracinus amylolyticus]